MSAQNEICGNEWLDTCCVHMETMFESWTLEKCKAPATEYNTRNTWQKPLLKHTRRFACTAGSTHAVHICVTFKEALCYVKT